MRTRPLNAAGRAALREAVDALSETAQQLARSREKPAVPPWAKSEATHFAPHVFLELLTLRGLIWEARPNAAGWAMRLGLSAVLNKFALSGGAPDRRIGRGIPSGFWAKKMFGLLDGLAGLEAARPENTPQPKVLEGDARLMHELLASPLAHAPKTALEDRDLSAKFSLVVTSPPYAGTYDYGAEHAGRFVWMGLERDVFSNQQVGARRGQQGTVPSRRHRRDTQTLLSRCGVLLKQGGAMVVVVGDGVVDGAPEDAKSTYASLCEEAGLGLEAWACQARPPVNPHLADIFGDVARHEHILLLRKR